MLDNFEEMWTILERVSIFGGLTEAELHQIYQQCELVEYKAGDVIIREKTPATEIYVILSGMVKVVLGIDSEPFEVTRFGAGECLGETSVIGVLNHSASVIAITDTKLLVFTRKHLTDIFHRDKNLFGFIILNIARELARRLHHTDEILLHYNNDQKNGSGTHDTTSG